MNKKKSRYSTLMYAHLITWIYTCINILILNLNKKVTKLSIDGGKIVGCMPFLYLYAMETASTRIWTCSGCRQFKNCLTFWLVLSESGTFDHLRSLSMTWVLLVWVVLDFFRVQGFFNGWVHQVEVSCVNVLNIYAGLKLFWSLLRIMWLWITEVLGFFTDTRSILEFPLPSLGWMFIFSISIAMI